MQTRFVEVAEIGAWCLIGYIMVQTMYMNLQVQKVKTEQRETQETWDQKERRENLEKGVHLEQKEKTDYKDPLALLVPQVLLLVGWYTSGGEGPHVQTPLEHNLFMQEGLLVATTPMQEVEQSISAYPMTLIF